MSERMLWIGGIVGTIALGFFFYALVRNKAPIPEPQKLRVAASFYPLYFFATEIGGNSTTVYTVTPEGSEPHDYEPTAHDIARISESRILVINGGGLEPWVEKIKTNLNADHTLLIEAGQGLATQRIIERGESVIDPHIWLSPSLAKQMVEKIAQGFAVADPTHADSYALNAEALKKKLDTLDLAYQKGLGRCAQKNIIISHASFGYLATSYQFNQVPIAGISPDAEPSAKQLAEVADFAKKNDIKFIFFESLVSPKLAQTIADETGAQTMALNPLEGLTDEDIVAGKNYITEMEQNLANLKLALQCTS